MTEADIVKLHEVWPEGRHDMGMMLHQAPESILLELAAHRWDSVALREMILGELGSRIEPWVTTDVGFVHTKVMIDGERICTDHCPHPDHRTNE